MTALVRLILATVVAFALGSGFGWYKAAEHYRLVEVKKDLDAEREARRFEEKRRDAVQEVIDAATRKARRNADNARALDRDVDSLRAQLAEANTRAASASAGDCASATAHSAVLTELLGESTERAAALAREADSTRAAGEACQSAYERARGVR